MQLTRKNQAFLWESKHEKAFKEIKTLFTNKSTLQSYNSEKRLTVEILREENILQEYNTEKRQTLKTDAS